MRIATVGYHVLLPNLYYRNSKNFQMNWSEEGRKEMFEMTRHLSISLVMNDVKALLSHTDNQAQYKKQKVGVVGYCMSGPFSIAAASFFPDRIYSAASIYGANLVTKRDDSPHRIAKQAKADEKAARLARARAVPARCGRGASPYSSTRSAGYHQAP